MPVLTHGEWAAKGYADPLERPLIILGAARPPSATKRLTPSSEVKPEETERKLKPEID